MSTKKTGRTSKKEKEGELSKIEVGIQVILIRKGKILLGKRKKGYGAGTWGLPGGRLNFNEKIVAAGLRELKEETSLEGREAEVVCLANTPFPKGIHHIQIGVVVRGDLGKPQVMEKDKCERWKFFNLNDLPSEKEIFPSSRQVIQNFLKGRIFTPYKE